MRVPRTGLANIHKDEAVLEPRSADMLRKMLSSFMGGAMGQQAYGYGSTSNAMSISGGINIYQQPGQSGMDVAMAVEKRLKKLFRDGK
jgi:hypothetical protein